MIRRPATFANDEAAWCLISQVEHARMAGEMSAAWIEAAGDSSSAASPFQPLVDPAQLVPAVFSHDDGWKEWELSPRLDPAEGRPYDFTEMPLDAALSIWQKSIAAAEPYGALAAYVVSGHFAALLRRAQAGRKFSPEETAMAGEFLDRQDVDRPRWLATWLNKSPENTAAAGCLALAQLQMFDLLSLWLCCAARTTPKTFTVAGGGEMEWRPIADMQQSDAAANLASESSSGTDVAPVARIAVHPWPFRTESLSLSAPCCELPTAHYDSVEACNYANRPKAVLRWELVPAGSYH